MANVGEPGGAATGGEAGKGLVIKVVSLKFDSDHGLLKDNAQDWKKDGKKYSEIDPKEWVKGRRGFPISQTKGTKLTVTAEFGVGPADGESKSGKLYGNGGQHFYEFETSGSFNPGKVTFTMTAAAVLPDRVRYRSNVAMDWIVDASGEIFYAGASGPSSIYVTMDTPKDEGAEEDGATHRRMNAAVRLVEAVGSNDPHEIVAQLMGKFKHYTLKRDPRVPAKYQHPTYMGNGEGDAWPMFEHIGASGECQAIVRFVKGVIHQVGCPGKAEAVIVYANPSNGNAIESAYGGPGMSQFGPMSYNGMTVYAALADTPVLDAEVGTKVFPPSHTRTPGGISMGLNNYEACLKFTHGATKYYGGGAGVFASKDEVITAFQALVWVRWLNHGHFTVERVVRRYR